MRIQHNIAAMNSYRNYTANNKAVAKNLEKLSSGYKINRAGDDAAGLAISEKMRAQITGIKTAQKNAKDGISLVQTAEGALTEVHSMLNRMVELADQSANGTYDNEVDRANLQKEVTALSTEIDRIADSSNFNGIKLLDGSLSADANNSATAAKQLMHIAGGGTTTAGTAAANHATTGIKTERQAATAAKHVFSDDGNALAKDDRLDAFEISFKNSKGETKTITLAEGAANGVANGGEEIAKAINGSTAGLALTTTNNNPDDLAEFRALFNVTGSTTTAAGNKQGISIQAKDPTSGADLVSFKAATGATAAAAVGAVATVAVDKNSAAAEKAGYSVDLNKGSIVGTTTNIAINETVKVGDKTYEFVTAGTKPVGEGNVAIALGANDGASTENLLAQLKKDGFTAEISANDTSKIVFTKMDELKQAQGGKQVSASNGDMQIDKQAAVKQKTTINIGAGTAEANGSTSTLDFSYVDASGKAQTKKLTYTSSDVSAAENQNAIIKAIQDDTELSALFEIKEPLATTITIESRGTGEGAASFSGLATSDTLGTAIGTQTTTAGKVEGKTVEMKSGESIKAGDTITIDGKVFEFSKDSGAKVGDGHIRVMMGEQNKDSMKNLSTALTDAGIKHDLDKGTGKLTFDDRDVSKGTGGLTLQIGDTAESFNKLTVSVNDMHTKALGIGNLDITDQTKGAAAVEKLRTAINTVSSTRGDLGATQNRLDHTINNLTVMHENIQDAEASIRDVDVADEMMAYTKNNILVQSAQAMLAQANQLPQGVLQLLQ